jgi:hypothetical protein
MTFIKTPLNSELHLRNYEINEDPSETVPDQSMSIRTILERYSRGLPISGERTPIWQQGDDYNDLPDPRTLDLAERQELAESIQQELKNIKKTWKSENKTSDLQKVSDISSEEQNGVLSELD